MPPRKLTAAFCASVQPEPHHQISFTDTEERGLEFRISATGNKVWSLRYRTPAGDQRRVTLGIYGAHGGGVGLKEARLAASRVKLEVAGGGDPAADRSSAKAELRAQTVHTFGDLAALYVEACEAGEWPVGRRPKALRTIADDKAVLRRYLGDFAKRKLDEIDRVVVKRLLRELTKPGKHSDGRPRKALGAQAARTQAFIRQAFNFALVEEIAPQSIRSNPAAGFIVAASAGVRERVLSDGELRALWGALAPAEPLVRPTGAKLYIGPRRALAVRVLALTLQRRAEVAGMRLSELDLDQATWMIPAGRMKGRRQHVLPLSPYAVELIRKAIALGDDDTDEKGARSEFVFPAQGDRAKPMHPDTLTNAVGGIAGSLGMPPTGPHDLRRTAATVMASERLRIPPFIISRILAHADDLGGGARVTAKHYSQYGYLPEMRAALTAWEGLLLEIVGEREPASNVTQLRAG